MVHFNFLLPIMRTSILAFQHELLRVLYPVFIHCFMDLVAKGHIQEGPQNNISFESLM